MVRSNGLSGGGLLLVAGLVIVAVVGVALLGGCEGVTLGSQDRQAQRLAAQAELARAEAEADSERAAARQMERDAAHQRALDVLPFVIAIGGGVVIVLGLGLVAWDVRTSRPAHAGAADLAILAELRRLAELQERQGRRERAILRVLAGRPVLPEGRGPVTIYPEGGRQ